jgi:hypothetical protein
MSCCLALLHQAPVLDGLCFDLLPSSLSKDAFNSRLRSRYRRASSACSRVRLPSHLVLHTACFVFRSVASKMVELQSHCLRSVPTVATQWHSSRSCRTEVLRPASANDRFPEMLQVRCRAAVRPLSALYVGHLNEATRWSLFRPAFPGTPALDHAGQRSRSASGR